MQFGRQLRRLVAATTVLTLASVVSLVPTSGATNRKASAVATSNGVGTTQSNQTVLDLGLGNLLNLNLLSDTGQAVTQDVTKALASIAGLKLSSNLIPALNVSVPTNPVVAQLPGGAAASKDQVSLGGSLTGLLKGVPLLSGLGTTIDQSGLVTGGVLPIDVQAALATLSSTVGGNAKLLSSLGLLDGLASINSLTSNLTQGSTTDSASVSRVLHVDTLGVLNLGGLLALLTNGNLLSLPLGVLSTLLSSLGVPVPDVAGLAKGDLTSLVTGLTATLTNLTANSPVASLTAPVVGLLTTLLGGALPAVATTGGLPNLAGLISTVQTTLTNLLSSVLGNLANTPLLKLNALNISAATNAVADVASSVASSSCGLGSIQIANLPAISLSAVNDVLATVAKLVNTVVSALPLGLNKLLQLSICGQTILGDPLTTGSTKNISTSNGVVTATASTSALSIGVHPEALLGAISGGGSPLGTLLSGLFGAPAAAPVVNQSAALPADGTAVLISARTPVQAANALPTALPVAIPSLDALNLQALALDKLLGGVTNVLGQGLNLDVGKVTATSTHTVLAQPPAVVQAPPAAIPEAPVQKLALTGNDSTPWLAGGGMMVMLGLVGVALRRRSRTTT
jgi:LPXTG-motif cell wall-anchored protein